MLTRRQLTQLLLAMPFAARASTTPNAPVLLTLNGVKVPGANLNISALPAGSTAAAANQSAYAALKVSGMAAGTSFNDPVTGVKTVKLTDSTHPAAGQWCNEYSTLGIQISQAWGPNLDQYTLVVLNTSNGSMYALDYKLGGTVSNYRPIPGNEGTISFSRKAGWNTILYIATPTQLQMYDTAKNAYANVAPFPINWSTGNMTWLQLNTAETWATALTPSNQATALHIPTGTVITQSVNGLNELYSGDLDVALLILNSGGPYAWNLDTNVLTPVVIPSGASAPFHCPTLRGFWATYETNQGGGVLPIRTITDADVVSIDGTITGYWGQMHSCGHWRNGSGQNQWFLTSTWDNGSGWTPWMNYNNIFVNAGTGATRVLGGHYSTATLAGTNSGGTDAYRSQPHATQSADGMLVMFSSNMLNGPRIDTFLMEVPTSS
jgi:hypothetical protein